MKTPEVGGGFIVHGEQRVERRRELADEARNLAEHHREVAAQVSSEPAKSASGRQIDHHLEASAAALASATRHDLKADKFERELAEKIRQNTRVEGGEKIIVSFTRHPGRAILAALRRAGFAPRDGAWHGLRAELPEILRAALTE